ncbi:MAG: YegP family protein [Enterobacteriaceae bacterium]
MTTGYYELNKTKSGLYFFTLKARNGKVLLTSEIYASQASAKHSVFSVQCACTNAKQYNLRYDHKNNPYFVLQAKNNEVIGKSKTYSSKTAAQRGIKLAIQYGCSDEVRDKTC